MENTQDLFLELLRSGLWGTSPNPAHFVHADWDAVFKLADIQTVGTIVLDGVALLPKDVHPPLGIKMRRIGAMQQVERTNALHRKTLAAIHATLAKEGIREVYMKGQMAGMRYPNPLHRQPGDIDLWMDAGRKEVVGYVRKYCPTAEVVYHHADFPVLKEAPMELHFTPSWLNDWWLNSPLA